MMGLIDGEKSIFYFFKSECKKITYKIFINRIKPLKVCIHYDTVRINIADSTFH